MKKILWLAGAGLLACHATNAMATEDGWYLGAGIGAGATSVKNTQTEVSNTYPSNAWRVTAGYQFSESVSIESEYVNVGQFVDASVTVDVTSYGASVLSRLPLGKRKDWALYGRVGISTTTTKATPAPGYALLGDALQARTGVTLGGGVDYALTPWAVLRLSLDSYEYASMGSAVAGRLGVVALNGIFRF